MIKLILEEKVTLPEYKTDGAVGFDLSVNKVLKVYHGDKESSEETLKKVQNLFKETGYIKLRPSERILFGTGIKVELPDDMELQIRPRSGTSLKTGLMISNSPGTIDSDYRGEIGIILYNSSPTSLTTVTINQNVAQAVPKKVIRPGFEVIHEDKLSETKRGENGYGSTSDKV